MRAFAALLALALPLAPSLHADEYNSARGFFIDLPEGYALVAGDGAESFSFSSPDGTVQVDIRSYPADRYRSVQTIASETTKRLGATGTPKYFRYAGRETALAELRFKLSADGYRGHALFVDGTPDRTVNGGGQDSGQSYDLVIIAYARERDYSAQKDALLSVLDGFSADAAARNAPGPVGAEARAALSASSPVKEALINFGQAGVRVPWRPAEGAIAQATVEREYRVLVPYGAMPDLTVAAVRRFYRMVLRDSSPSLDLLALELARAWDSAAWHSREPDGLSAAMPAQTAAPRFGPPADARAYASALLSWTQSWSYERSPAGSDVVNPLSAAMEGRGDCDSRALVLVALLRRENIRAILLVSLAHQHALAAIDAPGPGARFPYEGRGWLVAETTAKVGIGLIEQKQSSIADWFAVDFP